MDIIDWRIELVWKARHALRLSIREQSEGRDEAALCWKKLYDWYLFIIRKIDRYIYEIFLNPLPEVLAELNQLDPEFAARKEIEALISFAIIQELYICDPIGERMGGITIVDWAKELAERYLKASGEWYSAGLEVNYGNQGAAKLHQAQAEEHLGVAGEYVEKFSERKLGFEPPIVEAPVPPPDKVQPVPDSPPVPPYHT